MNIAMIQRLLGALLLANCALHLVTAVLGAADDIRLPLIAFGLAYGAFGLWVSTGRRPAVLLTLVATALGLALGGVNYMRNGGPIAVPFMFALDAGVLIAGALWLMKSKAGAQ